MEMSPAEKAEMEMARQMEQARALSAAYRTVFGSKEGRLVLEDLRKHFDPAAARFPAAFTRSHPLAAFFGGIHYDGSAVVVAHILARMGEEEVKSEK